MDMSGINSSNPNLQLMMNLSTATSAPLLTYDNNNNANPNNTSKLVSGVPLLSAYTQNTTTSALDYGNHASFANYHGNPAGQLVLLPNMTYNDSYYYLPTVSGA